MWRDPEGEPGWKRGAILVPCGCCSPFHTQHEQALSHLQPLSPNPLGQLKGEHGGGRGDPDSPGTQASGPLAGTVGRLLYCVGHPGGIGGTEELHRATLQPHLTAALAEAGIGVDVVIVDAGRRAPPIARHQVHLGRSVSGREPVEGLPLRPLRPLRCPSLYAQGCYFCNHSCGWSCGWSPSCRSAHLPYLVRGRVGKTVVPQTGIRMG